MTSALRRSTTLWLKNSTYDDWTLNYQSNLRVLFISKFTITEPQQSNKRPNEQSNERQNCNTRTNVSTSVRHELSKSWNGGWESLKRESVVDFLRGFSPKMWDAPFT